MVHEPVLFDGDVVSLLEVDVVRKAPAARGIDRGPTAARCHSWARKVRDLSFYRYEVGFLAWRLSPRGSLAGASSGSRLDSVLSKPRIEIRSQIDDRAALAHERRSMPLHAGLHQVRFRLADVARRLAS
jgi:hypothetical protein